MNDVSFLEDRLNKLTQKKAFLLTQKKAKRGTDLTTTTDSINRIRSWIKDLKNNFKCLSIVAYNKKCNEQCNYCKNQF